VSAANHGEHLVCAESQRDIASPSNAAKDLKLSRGLWRAFRSWRKTNRHGGLAGITFQLKAALLLTVFASLYLIFLLSEAGGLSVVALALPFGVSQALVAINISHDASHNAVARSRRVNRVLSASLDLLGMSSALWRIKHVELHHHRPNLPGVDDDIEPGAIARFAPHQRWHPWHRYQHFYVWALYGFMSIKWQFWDDLLSLLDRRIGSRPIPDPAPGTLASLALGKLSFLAWAIAVPLALRDAASAAVFFLCSQFAGSFLTATTFQLAHCVDDVEWPTSRLGLGWSSHQLATTSDFAPRSRLLNFLLGGLNCQVVHHLFPGVCHTHYPRLVDIVEAAANEAGVTYRSRPSLWSALAAHYRWLKRMGKPPTATPASPSPPPLAAAPAPSHRADSPRCRPPR